MIQITNRTNVLDRLSEGIAQLTDSETWREWLTVQSRFHHYSFNNTLLIYSQCPDASRVAGFNAWRKLDRFVRKGEKAIWILAPMIYKVSDSESVDEITTKVLRGFKPVTVFDVAQTDGKDLPEICTRLDGDDDGQLFDQLRLVADQLGFTVEDTDDLPGTCNGDCNHELHRIRVRASNAPAQRVKTLAHELGHAILHNPADRPDDRGLLELEAESVAFVVMSTLSVDSGEYSFGYCAVWARGGDEAIAAIKASGARIQATAHAILSSLEGDHANDEAA